MRQGQFRTGFLEGKQNNHKVAQEQVSDLLGQAGATFQEGACKMPAA